jgi:DNA-directed RNA polymerase II subunit RPB2
MAADSLSAEGLTFLEKYFKENEFPLTRHHIDSYEKAVFDDIPSIIHSNNPIVFLKEPLDESGSVFAYRVEIFIGGDVPTPDKLQLTISPPVVTADQGLTVRRMFPNEARLRNLTYAMQINADILIRVTFTRPAEAAGAAAAGGGGVRWTTEVKEAPIVKGFPLLKLPILLRSRLCATGVADPARLEEMGECRNDYGGYFIIRGAEKVLITRGEQAFNSLYVEKRAEGDPIKAYASVVSLNPETKQTRRVALYMGKKGEIRVAIPMVRGVFPLFILFRAMGLTSDEEIVRMICPDEADPLADELIPSIEDAYPFHNKYTATRFIMSLTKGFTEAHVLDILQNLMLPHVPDEPLARAQYLAEMARETIRAAVGQRPARTDRDDMRNQRFLTTGVLVRELFNGCWKEWRAATILNIDRTYRDNADLYAGDQVFSLFAPGNLVKLFDPASLNKSIMRGYGGRWGTNQMNEKPGVLQPLARISYLDATSHQRRVVSDFDTGMKTTGPRKLHTSQIGYFCTSETPQGAHIGATKNMSIMTQFSFGAPTKPVYDWMRMKGGLIPVGETTAAVRATAAVVQINGGTVGFTLDPMALVRTLRLMKWNAFLSPTASVSFNTIDKTVRVYLDEGRPLRPLWHLNGEGAAFLDRMPALMAMRWRDLVFGTANAGATLRSVRFIDPLADNPVATADDYAAVLGPTAGFIEYCDPLEMNENYIAWFGAAEELTAQHTHAEIHPSTMTGLMASMIPYSNHNQAPRNQLSNSQSKQGIGYMATNYLNRYDTYAHQLCYGEAPLCRTFYYENIANGEMPYGFNCVIAATSETGYNQDDGLIINRDSVARGMFNHLAFRSYDALEEVDPITKVHSHVANPRAVPAWTSLRPGLDYSKLDERGIIREGEYVDENTVLVGRYMVVPITNEIKDASVTPELYTKGRVDSVVVLHQGDGHLLVKIRILEVRIPVLGDKFSTRHGQKGTIGMLVPSADMPRTADGLVPDVMVNPGGLISRMTVAQLVEMVAGRAAVDICAKFNATTFCNGGDFVTQLGDVLQAMGSSRAGDNIMYSGISGKQLATEIYMCPLYFMRLKHLTDDKVNARGMGRREMKTRQPTGGRANEGGMRMGEMERDTMCAHGVSAFFQESMMKRADGTKFWVCNGCGRIPIYNEGEKLFLCPGCDGPLVYNGVTADTLTLQLPTRQSRTTFSQVAMPYATKLLDQELTTFGNVGLRFITESTISRLREDGWNWPEMEIQFRGAEGVVEEGEDVNPDDKAEAEALIEEAKELKKQRRKEKVAGMATGPVAGAEGAAEVLAAAAAAAAGKGPAGAADAVQFYAKLANEYVGFSTFATAPFRMPGDQIPAPDGTAYPVLGGGEVARTTWPTVEHYYQAMKFPSEPAYQEEIRLAPTPARAKKMGLNPGHALRGDWDAIKERVMKDALRAKFTQNPGLLSILQGTGTKRLENVAPGDAYWGVGVRGAGRNRLGALLEEVREELKGRRVDQAMLAAAPPAGQIVPAAPENVGAESEPEDLAAEAEAAVAAVTGGAVQVAASAASALGGGGGGGGQSGGVYMIINPMMGGGVEAKARAPRQRGGRSLQWEGMGPVQQVGGGDLQDVPAGAQVSDEGGGASGHSTVVTLTKEE